ncbi:LacI family DNA-binding transcriptional regulator [Cellulomonas denverensis]|uniref:LacI family transcriptional regulator n=1 Tax=Cellulomonas denverensis TaxID=264297 RepID=A0A7X6KXF7_9CELL|nr:LacI family DNA-binding transcriptional regulator [Cellulomonas denverensis]NKY23720.1 LacI family transcriptional regulator [Cellulomonas denverensis]GIG25791.1 HTH-type transcriptional regulator MalR [Cellulomonas denverensis]
MSSTLPGVRTRLTDLAEQAGVSTATVSRVLNGKPGVSAQARQAVITAMDLLGYERPDKLRPRSTGLVGLVVPELSNPVFPAYAQVIESVLTQRGYTPLLCAQQPGGTTEDQYVEILLDHDVAGIIFLSGLHADTHQPIDRYQSLRGRGLPIVLVNGSAPGIDAPTVAADDSVAIDLAMRHLLSLGHRRIGLAIGPERFVPAQRKRRAFAVALRERLGITDDTDHVVSTLFTVEGGATAAHELIDQGHTAIICGSDLMALGVIRAARQRGLRVPEDLSVVGFDDSVLIGFTDPPLTTVRQPVQAMGRAAVAALMSEIAGTPTSRNELLFHPELIVRGSTGSAPL